MPSNTSQWVKTAISTAGAATAGPVGAILGRLAGSMFEASLPGVAPFLSSIAGSPDTGALQTLSGKITGRLSMPEKLHINHDLQAGFTDACCEALYDIGGKECFPEVWANQPREAPDAIRFPATPEGRLLWHRSSPLAAQIADCLQQLEQAVRGQLIIPLDPPDEQPAASAEVYLQAQTPAKLNQGFFDNMIWPFFAHYQSLHTELPALAQHLQRYLLDRSLVHLGEILKLRPAAWRAFCRAVLEGLHLQVRELSQGEAAIMQRLETLAPSGSSEQMADTLADLLAIYGQMEKDPFQVLDALGRRAVENHRAEKERQQMLAASSQRASTGAERTLRFLEDGKWIIEGPAPHITMQQPRPGQAGQPAAGELPAAEERPAAEGTSPYKGLPCFEEADAPLFFGRELLTAQLASHLNERPLLAVIGASGSGKSSLVRAGLIPALRSGKVQASGRLPPEGAFPPIGSESWPIIVLTPTAHPFESLAARLTHSSESIRESMMLLDDLKADPHSLEIFAQRLAGPSRSHRKVLLIVDQFEELFTLCNDPDERQAFIDALLEPISEGIDSPLRLVIALRADFYASCAQYPRLREALSKRQEYIGPMDLHDVRRAIEEPARLGGWEFEPGVVEKILSDFVACDSTAYNIIGRDFGARDRAARSADSAHLPEPGALPLLSHTLLETWKHRRGRMMTLESYAETGGVRKAVARSAESVYQERLDAAQQAAARRIFLRLAGPGEGVQVTRRRARLDEFGSGAGDEANFAAALQALTEARLVTRVEDSIEVAHEALIREWPTLQQWLEENREGIRVQRRLSEAAEAWQRGNQDAELLYRGERLAEASRWAEDHASEPNALEMRFLNASLALRQKEQDEARRRAEGEVRTAVRMRHWLVYLAVALLAAMVLAVFSAIAWQRADSSAKTASLKQQTAEAVRADALRQKNAAETARADAVQAAGATEQARRQTQEPGARALIEKGWSLYREAQYALAKTMFDGAAALDAAAVEANLGRAWAAYQLDDYPAAIADFEVVRAAQPALLDGSAWDALGWAYFWSESFEKSLESFTNAIAADPGFSDAYDGQGWAYYRLEDYPAAIAAFEKGLALDPEEVDFYDGLGHAYYRLNDYAKAIEYTEKAVSLDENYAYTLNLTFLGWAHFYLDELDKALAYFERARANDPQAYEPYQGIGDVHYAREEMDLALENYQKYLELIKGKGSPQDYILARVERLRGE